MSVQYDSDSHPAVFTGSRVTVVIPNRNGIQHLEECFATLEAQTYRDFCVTFVDNASSDDSVAWVREHYPQVEVIAREIDGGFSASVNDGIRSARGEFVSILNNDVRLDARWLEELVDALDTRPDYDFATPLLIMYYEPELVNAAGDVFSVTAMTGANRGMGRPVGEFLESKRVLGATANGVLYRIGFFDQVGLYDEDFYLIHEDTDINLRALIAGKRCIYVPSSRLHHKIRSSGNQYRPETIELLERRNEAMVIAKSLPVSVMFSGVVLSGRLWRHLRGVFPLRPRLWSKIPSLLRAAWRRDAARCRGFRMGWAKRRDVWSRRTIAKAEIRRWILEGTSDV